MAALPASTPMDMDSGTKGLDQSIHNPAAGTSQFNAPVALDPPHATPEAPGRQKIREMKAWKSLNYIIERDGTEIAIRAAVKDFLQAIHVPELPRTGTRTINRGNRTRP